MKLELAFRIYRKLMRHSMDFCYKVIIRSKSYLDPLSPPDEVYIKFIPKIGRKFKRKEHTHIRYFCKYHDLSYYFNQKGEMVWLESKSMQDLGTKKRGRM
jgi:hypothetical protein